MCALLCIPYLYSVSSSLTDTQAATTVILMQTPCIIVNQNTIWTRYASSRAAFFFEMKLRFGHKKRPEIRAFF